jgi:hypothetical protein
MALLRQKGKRQKNQKEHIANWNQLCILGLTNKPSERELRNTRMAQRQVEFQQMMRKQISRMDREREAEKKLRREAAAQSGKRGGQAYEREREHQEEEARYQEQRRQREWELMMRDYKPEVNLVYMDKHGNRLNAKEVRQARHNCINKCIFIVVVVVVRPTMSCRTNSMENNQAGLRQRND